MTLVHRTALLIGLLFVLVASASDASEPRASGLMGGFDIGAAWYSGTVATGARADHPHGLTLVLDGELGYAVVPGLALSLAGGLQHQGVFPGSGNGRATAMDLARGGARFDAYPLRDHRWRLFATLQYARAHFESGEDTPPDSYAPALSSLDGLQGAFGQAGIALDMQHPGDGVWWGPTVFMTETYLRSGTTSFRSVGLGAGWHVVSF